VGSLPYAVDERLRVGQPPNVRGECLSDGGDDNGLDGSIQAHWEAPRSLARLDSELHCTMPQPVTITTVGC
jgi:hypothetical protein